MAKHQIQAAAAGSGIAQGKPAEPEVVYENELSAGQWIELKKRIADHEAGTAATTTIEQLEERLRKRRSELRLRPH